YFTGHQKTKATRAASRRRTRVECALSPARLVQADRLPVAHAVGAAPGRRAPARGVAAIRPAHGVARPRRVVGPVARRVVGVPEGLDLVLLRRLAERRPDHRVEELLVPLG